MWLPPPAAYASSTANDVSLSDVHPNVLPPSPSGNTSRSELPITVIVETLLLRDGNGQPTTTAAAPLLFCFRGTSDASRGTVASCTSETEFRSMSQACPYA